MKQKEKKKKTLRPALLLLPFCPLQKDLIHEFVCATRMPLPPPSPRVQYYMPSCSSSTHRGCLGFWLQEGKPLGCDMGVWDINRHSFVVGVRAQRGLNDER